MLRMAGLIAGFLRKILCKKEQDELQAWITANDKNRRLFDELTDALIMKQSSLEFDLPNDKKSLARIKKKIHFTTTEKRIE